MTVVTHKYLQFVSHYSRVLKCTTGVTHEYLQLDSNHLRAVYFLYTMSLTRKLSLKILSHEGLHAFFVSLDVSCTVLGHT